MAEGDAAEEDGQPSEVRGKRMRRSGTESASGLPSGVVGIGGAGTDAAYRQQPVSRSTAARRHTRVPKPKLRRCSPAAAAPAESDECVDLEDMEWEGLNEVPLNAWEDAPGPAAQVPAPALELSREGPLADSNECLNLDDMECDF